MGGMTYKNVFFPNALPDPWSGSFTFPHERLIYYVRMHEEHELRWDALEYEHFDKTPDWYWGLGLITVLSVAGAIFLENLLFAAVILLSAFALALYGARSPKMERFALTSRGLVIGDSLYPYQSLDSFWVHDTPEEQPVLIVKSRKILMPLMVIPITHVSPREIRNHLLNEMKEEEHHTPLADKFMRYFHF